MDLAAAPKPGRSTAGLEAVHSSDSDSDSDGGGLGSFCGSGKCAQPIPRSYTPLDGPPSKPPAAKPIPPATAPE